MELFHAWKGIIYISIGELGTEIFLFELLCINFPALVLLAFPSMPTVLSKI